MQSMGEESTSDIATSVCCRAFLIDINCLLAHLHRAASLETTVQAGAKSLILNPGHFVVQIILLLSG
jgi:hypothetical protein